MDVPDQSRNEVAGKDAGGFCFAPNAECFFLKEKISRLDN